jgi:hypothetical protein
MGATRLDQNFGDFAGAVLADAPVFFPLYRFLRPRRKTSIADRETKNAAGWRGESVVRMLENWPDGLIGRLFCSEPIQLFF